MNYVKVYTRDGWSAVAKRDASGWRVTRISPGFTYALASINTGPMGPVFARKGDVWAEDGAGDLVVIAQGPLPGRLQSFWRRLRAARAARRFRRRHCVFLDDDDE